MITIEKLDQDTIGEIVQSMGYDPENPSELKKYITEISKMDLWDISRILFFGNGDAKRIEKVMR